MTIIVSPTASETTLDSLRTLIQQKGYGTDTSPEIQTAMLNSIYRRIIGARRWWFYEVADDHSTSVTTGDERVDLSVAERLFLVDAVRLEYNTTYVELMNVDPQEFREYYHADRTPGTPQLWTQVNDEVLLWPVPDKDYTVSLDYIKRPPTLVNDDDQVIIPEPYVDVLVWGAIRELCFRERDDSGRAYADAEYQQVLADMKQQDGLMQRQSASEVTYTGQPESVNYGYG